MLRERASLVFLNVDLEFNGSAFKIVLTVIESIQLTIRQFLARFSTIDWFLDVLKISTEHGSRVPVANGLGNSKQDFENNIEQEVVLFLIVTYLLPLGALGLPGLAPNSVKHNIRNSWKSISTPVK